MSAEQSYNSRNIALSMLMETLEEKRLSHYVVKDYFNSGNKQLLLADAKRDRDFIMTIYMGTIEKVIYLDFLINSFSNVNTMKMKPVIKNILRLSIYQLEFMNSVPERAVLSEAQKLCEIRKLNGLKAFVNGVLHMVIRKKDELEVPEHISKYAPKWLYTLATDQYGKEKADLFFNAVNNRKNFFCLKLNTLKKEPDTIIRSLENDGCTVEKIADIKDGVRAGNIKSITELEAYKQGWIYIQDLNSMRIAEVAKTEKPKIIVDVCGAPGGKTIDLSLEYPEAVIISRDINDTKTGLIKENAKRLGLMNVQTQTVDATVSTPELVGKADIVIADLPCSGLGVIAGKPDIKLRVREKDLKELAQLQRKILSVVQAYVKPGGVLVFSTCTINKGENEENAVWFNENYDFSLISQRQFLPGVDDGDGFYFARFEKYV